MSAFTLLIVIAIILSIIAIVKPAYPVLAVAVILICTALLIGKHFP